MYMCSKTSINIPLTQNFNATLKDTLLYREYKVKVFNLIPSKLRRPLL